MIGTHVAGDVAADHVVVAVRQHDHVAGVGPVPFAVVARDPARAASDDVEQDHAFGARVEQVGERRRRRLERERLGELGAEEDRALEAQLLERVLAASGVAARSDGSSVMVARPVPPDTARCKQ